MFSWFMFFLICAVAHVEHRAAVWVNLANEEIPE